MVSSHAPFEGLSRIPVSLELEASPDLLALGFILFHTGPLRGINESDPFNEDQQHSLSTNFQKIRLDQK